MSATPPANGAPQKRSIVSIVIPPLILSAIAATASYIVSGATLGVFLAGFLFATLLTPPLVISEPRWSDRVLALTSTLLPMSVIWLVASLRSDSRMTELAVTLSVLAAYSLALAGLAVAFRMLRVSAAVTAFLTTILGLAWLTWPIWLSPTWQGEASALTVARLGDLHPALAANAQLLHLGNWTEQSIAYHLTDLNQNVPFAPPRTARPTILFHAAVGLGLIALSVWAERARRPVPDPVTSIADPA